MNKTIFILGGAGFIGSNFARLMIEKKNRPLMVVDKLTYAGRKENLAGLEKNSNFEFVVADINDGPKISALLSECRPSSLINFAAETHVDRSIDSPRAFIETNIMGTFQLLEAARSYFKTLSAPEQKSFRYLQVSTDEVYGTLGKTGKFREETAYRPNSPYAASKAAADHLVQAYHVTFGLPTLITNCSNNYGPYQFPEKLIPLMILNALEGKALPIYGDGKNVRDWIFVEDHCEGVWRVLTKGKIGETYNIGANEEHSNIEIVNAVCQALESFYPAARNPVLSLKGIKSYPALKSFVKDRPGHDRRYAIDSSKIIKTLKWRPKEKFKEGIKKTVRWYLDHRDWCEQIHNGNYQRERLGLTPAQG